MASSTAGERRLADRDAEAMGFDVFPEKDARRCKKCGGKYTRLKKVTRLCGQCDKQQRGKILKGT